MEEWLRIQALKRPSLTARVIQKEENIFPILTILAFIRDKVRTKKEQEEAQ